MKKILLISAIIPSLYSCVQNYPNEYKEEAIKTCECMEYKKTLRRKDISEDVVFIYEDRDYKECVLDAIINQVKVKSEEFTSAIQDVCPEHLETQKRYLEQL